ncbi:MAG: hypothetical protein MH186_15260 [Marinobacter sp.]|nr:hypothetical protein [Marinobacter sp.]
MMDAIARLGKNTLDFLASFGRASQFLLGVLVGVPKPSVGLPLLLKQMRLNTQADAAISATNRRLKVAQTLDKQHQQYVKRDFSVLRSVTYCWCCLSRVCVTF